MEKKQGIIIALIIVCILSVAVVMIYLNMDNDGPVITVDSSKVVPYSADQGEDVLKSYAKAVDEKDGDVSSSIIIENVYIMPDMTKAKVIYVARDSDNNVTKYSYIIAYEASDEEMGGEAGTESTDSQTVTEIETETKSIEQSTVATATAASADSKGTTEAVTKAGGPRLILSATEATVAKGGSFNIMKYISSLSDDKDTSDILSRRIIVGGSYTTAKTGNYTLDIYCTDSDYNESNHVEFILHVE